MFYHIEGIVADMLPNLAVIDCGGVGYALNTTNNTLSYLKKGEKAKLYIAEAISETSFDLYGFSTLSEKRYYDMLTSVSGIGPKAALSILSYNTPETLTLAVVNEDTKALTAAPGIGKKIAMRVILELKDKIGKEYGGEISVSAPAAALPQKSDSYNDAVAALMVLGYSSAEIGQVLNKMDLGGMSTEQIIKTVLKQM